MNRLAQSAYNLATYVARNKMDGVARDAFDVVDEAASVLASEVREKGYVIDALRTDLRLAQEARCRVERQRDEARDRHVKELQRMTEKMDLLQDQRALVGILMDADVMPPSLLYIAAPDVVTGALAAVKAGKKIDAMKIIYKATGGELKTCKEWVEQWMMQDA